MAPVAARAPAALAAGTGLRGLLVRLHRWLGLSLAAFLILAGLTGSFLVFQREIDGALNPALWRVTAPGPSLSPAEIAARVEARDPRVTARWTPLEARPTSAYDVWVDWKLDPSTGQPFAREYDQMFVDPVSGAINGTRSYGACCVEREHLVPFVHKLHSSLWLSGRAGAILLGAVALLWLVDSVIGLALTLPRGGGLRGWGKSWRVKRSASSTRRTFDLHRAGGLWAWGLLALMAVTSLSLTLEEELVKPAVERFSPIAPEPYERRPMAPPDRPIAPRLGFDAALAAEEGAARAAGVGRPASGIYYARETGLYAAMFGREEEAGIAPSWVFVDGASGAAEAVPAASGSAGDVFMRLQLPLHAGRAGGMAGRVLVFLLGFAVAALAVTGVLIWRRKRLARTASRGAGAPRLTGNGPGGGTLGGRSGGWSARPRRSSPPMSSKQESGPDFGVHLSEQPGVDFHRDRRPERGGGLSPLAKVAVTVGSAVASVFAVRAGLAQHANSRAAPDMQRVLDKMAELGAQPFEKLSVEQARNQPTPADAVKALAGGARSGGVTSRDLQIDGAAGPLPARLYTPAGASGASRGLIVYWHGGGWVFADLDVYDAGPRALARETGAAVLSCHYRQAPEHRFPAAHEDALAAYAWAVRHADELGAGGGRIAVAGESAGGNLAANVSLEAPRRGLPKPMHQLLVYPVASANLNSSGYLQNARAKPLSRAGMKWFVEHVFDNASQAKDPRLDLVNRGDLRNSPPTTIVNADIDPLRSDGEKLAEMLGQAGVPVRQRTYQGVTHEFFGMDAVVAGAREAQALAGAELRRALGS